MTESLLSRKNSMRFIAGILVGFIAFGGNASFLFLSLCYLIRQMTNPESDSVAINDRLDFWYAVVVLVGVIATVFISLFIAILLGRFVAYHDFNSVPDHDAL